MGDILEQKGYYDALITSFEDIRDKRDVVSEEVTELEKQKRALDMKIADLMRRLSELDTSLDEKTKERDTCTGFIEDLEAGGLRAKAALLRLARGTMTLEQRADALREDLKAAVQECVEPVSPKLGSSKKMHHEAVQTMDTHFLQSGGKDPVKVRCYSGALPGTDSAGLPVVVYFHGEGYVAGDFDTHDWLCRSFAAMSRVTVVAVDYRRAPEARFPAAFEDAYAALGWVANGGLGSAPPRLAVAGDSAGAGLAAACCLRARDDPQGPTVNLQVLFYPWLDLRPDAPSLTTESEDGGLMQDNLFWYRVLYAPLEPEKKEAPDTKRASADATARPSLASMVRPGSVGSKSSTRSRPASSSKPPKPPSRPPSDTRHSAAGSATGSACPTPKDGEAPEPLAPLEEEAEEVPWFMDARASPVLAKSLAGLPRAFIAYAEDDPLSIDAVTYAERLVEEGAGPEAVHTLHLQGPCGHGFAKLQGMPEARSALSAAAAFASASLKG